MVKRHCSKVRGNDRDRVATAMLDNRSCVEQEGSGFIPNPRRAIHLVHNMDLRDDAMEQFRRAFEDGDDVSPSSLRCT
jgi:hypothetical protein